MIPDVSWLNLQHYKVQIKGKWSNPENGVAPSVAPWCSSYLKGSLQVALNYGWPTYIYIYIYGEKVDIFGRPDKMMENKWNSGYTKTQTMDSVQNISFFIYRKELFQQRNIKDEIDKGVV